MAVLIDALYLSAPDLIAPVMLMFHVIARSRHFPKTGRCRSTAIPFETLITQEGKNTWYACRRSVSDLSVTCATRARTARCSNFEGARVAQLSEKVI